MNAILFQDGEPVLQKIDSGALNEGWVRLRVQTVGLCGTDVAKYASRILPPYHTTVLGHEFVGIVEHIHGASTRLSVGDMVAVMPLLPCNNCPCCISGHTNLCRSGKAIGRTELGAFAETVDVPVENTVQIPGEDPDAFILLDPLAVCVHANSFIGENRTTKTCLIIGDGTIGCLQAWYQRLQGDEVWMLGKHPSHITFMEQFGIRAYESWKDSRKEFDVVFEAVGRSQAQTLEIAIEKTAPRGKVIVLGVFESGFMPSLEVRKAFIKETSIVGVNAYTPTEFMQAYEIVRSWGHELKKFITHRVPLSRLKVALDLVQRKRSVVLKIGLTNDLTE
jgi:threonine dehydrogenase-like Zn-dependent dehydrogenase